MLSAKNCNELGIIILTCEHGGNAIPSAYQEVFRGQEEVVCSHKGWDIGALLLAKGLSKSLGVPLHYSTTSRLVVELNRSLHHPHLFSAFTKSLSVSEKQHILAHYYHPYRTKVENSIREAISANGQVLHISVHSFTPMFEGTIRKADFGLLYDPATEERVFCQAWKAQITATSHMNVRFNYPYKGTADGFTTYLRKCFPQGYRGIELEVNQQLLSEGTSIKNIEKILVTSLRSII